MSKKRPLILAFAALVLPACLLLQLPSALQEPACLARAPGMTSEALAGAAAPPQGSAGRLAAALLDLLAALTLRAL